MSDSEVVTIVSAEAQEEVDVDFRLLDSVRWPKGTDDPRYKGVGSKRWLSKTESDILREALLPLVAGPEDNSVKKAVDLIDYALSTGAGVAIILP